MVEPLFPAAEPPVDRRPALGYGMTVVAATLFGFNGAVSKVVLASGLDSLRLTEVRSTGAAVGLVALVAAAWPGRLRLRRAELPFFLAFGVLGVSFVQLLYFLAIHRLPVGIALLLEYLAPLLVAVWARFVVRERVRRRIWLALALALCGLAGVVQIWNGLTLDGLGVAFGLASALAYCIYILLAERGVRDRDSISVAALGFSVSALFWAVVQPWWSFPARLAGRDVSLLGHLGSWHLPIWALTLWVIVPGTIVPFGLIISALKHLPATRVGIVAMLEPVAAAVVAWAWLGESLDGAQLAGGAVVLAAISLAQTAR
jgi:drug/metabolite transporter (DMT)-like permease